jgi:hypothetical protein
MVLIIIESLFIVILGLYAYNNSEIIYHNSNYGWLVESIYFPSLDQEEIQHLQVKDGVVSFLNKRIRNDGTVSSTSFIKNENCKIINEENWDCRETDSVYMLDGVMHNTRRRNGMSYSKIFVGPFGIKIKIKDGQNQH